MACITLGGYIRRPLESWNFLPTLHFLLIGVNPF